MPISDTEWDSGATQASSRENDTTPVGEYEDEKDLIVAFLSENVDNTYTKTEVIKGVNFGNNERPETIREALSEIPNELMDIAGPITASTIVVGDVEEALDQLVEEGMVEKRDIETDDGTTTYYRLNTGDSWE